jgi:hypothetical protein
MLRRQSGLLELLKPLRTDGRLSLLLALGLANFLILLIVEFLDEFGYEGSFDFYLCVVLFIFDFIHSSSII